jgi:membrane carboxypeptidase/penicillin-binding protein PbpC
MRTAAVSDAFWNYLFAALPGTLAALAALYATIQNGLKIKNEVVPQIAALKNEVVPQIAANVFELKEKVNGQTHALITAKEDIARAVGELAGKALGKEEARSEAAVLVVAVADKQAADQALRAEGLAQGHSGTRRDDVKEG